MKNLFLGLLTLAGTASFANNSKSLNVSKPLHSIEKTSPVTKPTSCCKASAGGSSVTYCGDVSSSQACRTAIALLRMTI